MPIYAYRCATCGHTRDVLQKLSDEPLSVCPACGAPEFKKQLTAAGFQLKGSGWYATDFRNSGAAPAPKADAAVEGKSGGKDAGKAEGKIESKSDSPGGESAAKPAAAPTPPAASAPESK
jgi:putative FmdB family regulatory protein